MAAETHNITIEQGATFRLNLVWKDSGGTPINLTGYTARMQVRRKHTSPDPPLLTFTTENGAITLGGALGTIAIVGLATLTDDVDIKSGVYDLELVSGTEVTRLIEGAVTITPEVTR
jgi:hypothetical protein